MDFEKVMINMEKQLSNSENDVEDLLDVVQEDTYLKSLFDLKTGQKTKIKKHINSLDLDSHSKKAMTWLCDYIVTRELKESTWQHLYMQTKKRYELISEENETLKNKLKENQEGLNFVLLEEEKTRQREQEMKKMENLLIVELKDKNQTISPYRSVKLRDEIIQNNQQNQFLDPNNIKQALNKQGNKGVRTGDIQKAILVSPHKK